jgi:hypothetical protein
MRALEGKTPYEAWHGERPPVHYFRTFRCIRYVKNTRPHLNKPVDRSTPMIFVEYESGSKAWCFYDPNVGRVVVSRDVVFDEAGQWAFVAFVAITPQYNSHNQNSKSNMSSNNQAFTSHVLTGTILSKLIRG